MSNPLRDRFDRAVGSGIEQTVRRHHRRRLRRTGALAQMDPPVQTGLWAAASPPPREGCAMEVLIDGADALAAIADELAAAHSHVHISGWCMTPGFALRRGPDARRLRDVLGELAERIDVRVLLWAGAPVPLFKPTRPMVRDVRAELVRGTKVQCRLDPHERPMHCHHEKLVVVDDRVAFVNGIDLTDLGGDRYDASDHPARGNLGWHDAGTRLRGPVVHDVAAHFATRWHACGGDALPAGPLPEAAGDTTVQFVRTVPEHIYDDIPAGDFRILESYTRALRSAHSLVYLENQFLWSPEIVAILRAKLQDPPSDDFRILVLLPAKPNNGEDDTRGQLSVLASADDGRGRFLAATISSRSGEVVQPLYVHAKIGIVDDRWLTVGSANLNEHSLFNDTECNVVTCDPQLARQTRLRLWAEHLERDVEDVAGPAATVIDELWRPIAAEQLARRRADAPATHHLSELPGVSRRARTVLGPLKGLADDG